jgi:hypothetical protein
MKLQKRRTELAPLGMPRWRIWLLHTVIVLLITGSLYEIVADRETGPFAHYPMYSQVMYSQGMY